jgi:hypothetical protein
VRVTGATATTNILNLVVLEKKSPIVVAMATAKCSWVDVFLFTLCNAKQKDVMAIAIVPSM